MDTPDGPVIIVSGADLMNGTPIYDIKPYVSYTDAIPDAVCGFAKEAPQKKAVRAEKTVLERLPEEKREALLAVLAQDPRPKYHHDAERVYGFPFAGHEVRFRADEETVYLVEIE